jgi:hypothetical protein
MKMTEPHKIIENLTHLNNCCRSITDKIKHTEKMMEKSKFAFKSDECYDEAMSNLKLKLNALNLELIEAREKRVLARQEINELFASLRG